MPRFIPRLSEDRPKASEAEKVVFDALELKLSPHWIVLHNLPYVSRDQEGMLHDGEIDFVLYHPKRGMVILEVKGGEIAYREGKWFQDGTHITPMEQVRKNKYAILALLREKLNRNEVPLRIAHALCFPRCQGANIPWPPEARGLTICREELKGDLEEFLFRLLEMTPLPRGLRDDVRLDEEEILEVLEPEFELPRRLPFRLEEDSRVFERLTAEQTAIMEAMEAFPRLLVRGGAGTGKTVLALQKARMLADEGKEVLLLCYNELLAKKIQKTLERGCCNVQAMTFFRFCAETLGATKDQYAKHVNNSKLYEEIMPQFLEKKLDDTPLDFDAVIVDEGQDFTPIMWRVILRLVKPEGQFYVFYDPEQNIFRDELHLPDMATPPVTLCRNCRNTRKIIQALSPYHDQKMLAMDGTPEGADVMVLEGDCRDNLQSVLNTLFAVEKVPHSDVVILGAHSLANTCLGNDPTVGKYHVVENSTATNDAAELRYFTYMKFKGCESRVVILLEVNDDDPRWQKTGRYTAMSRATHLLIILESARTR